MIGLPVVTRYPNRAKHDPTEKYKKTVKRRELSGSWVVYQCGDGDIVAKHFESETLNEDGTMTSLQPIAKRDFGYGAIFVCEQANLGPEHPLRL